ncbi:response regulator [Pararcticibacter amylolyticus]|uniref:Response regulatory domain-containing protein n=1 Tax=Pararcticibacter amylolyticus TaxID=2173175 RepID=A0A2U2PIA0_9SPHI|nr:response regulator [Pararcticibacter amylolyticus]PWG80994.1 hypothetical protein DDR33_08660 [Pararcticibacter amylolyticus]
MDPSLANADKQLSGNVLVVEDNEINRFLIKKFLKKWGASGDFAENGKEALDKIRHHAYDVVLMDIQMPVMSGLEATIAIRNMEKQEHRQLPIIALTATILDQELEEIKKSGMNDYIAKPFSPDDLYRKLATFMQK